MNQQINSRQRRVLSEALKKKIVRDIETKGISVLNAAGEYDVSFQAVYGWLKKYSRHLKPTKTESEGYRTKELEKRIKDLEAALGRSRLSPPVVPTPQRDAWLQIEGCLSSSWDQQTSSSQKKNPAAAKSRLIIEHSFFF